MTGVEVRIELKSIGKIVIGIILIDRRYVRSIEGIIALNDDLILGDPAGEVLRAHESDVRQADLNACRAAAGYMVRLSP